MSNLKDIKKRIKSVKNTQKITNAMKLVSAAKFSKATQAVHASKPYEDGLLDLKREILQGISPELMGRIPLLNSSSLAKRVRVILISSDRGLCGSLNSGLFKELGKWQNSRPRETDLEFVVFGKKGIAYLEKNNHRILRSNENGNNPPLYSASSALATELIGDHVSGKFDQCWVAYTAFVSAISQEPTITKLLPVSADTISEDQVVGEGVVSEDRDEYQVEPGRLELLEPLMKRVLSFSLYRCFLESSASEHGARMAAMDAATNNAKEVTKKLTLQFNRARQAAITTELTEIISGAQALS